jgi:hypothetical protein
VNLCHQHHPKHRSRLSGILHGDTTAGAIRIKKQKLFVFHLPLWCSGIGDVSAPDAQYAVCNKVLLNSSMFSAKLHRYLEITYTECMISP